MTVILILIVLIGPITYLTLYLVSEKVIMENVQKMGKGLIMGPLITAVFISVFEIFRRTEGGIAAQ